MVGCFLGGWAADSIGRINGIFLGAIVSLVGGALQAAAQGADFMLVARVITGTGTGGKWLIQYFSHYFPIPLLTFPI